MRKRSESKPQSQSTAPALSAVGHLLAAMGPKMTALAGELFPDRGPLFADVPETDLRQFAEVLRSGWSEQKACQILRAYADRSKSDAPLEISALTRWLRLHPDDAKAVIDCMNVEPPEEVTVIRVLSRAGSQKLVFLATWRLRQREVVLKYLTGPPEQRRRVMARELQLHPLSIAHDNIIETHLLLNKKGEPFLAEKRLSHVLSDEWPCPGVHEAANLLHDIADALTFLKSHRLVHGDVKPDNIGKDGDDYILLDFGICRPAEEFTAETTGTGSLRTRAPELLEKDAYGGDPFKVDVWALGATVFNALVKRFPLFDKGNLIDGKKLARVSHPVERNKAESLLLSRAQTEWEQRVINPVRETVPGPMGQLLLSALERDPEKRCPIEDLKNRAGQELSAFLRPSPNVRRFAPSEEYRQLVDYIRDRDVLRLMPMTQKHRLKDRLTSLMAMAEFTPEQKAQLKPLWEAVQE